MTDIYKEKQFTIFQSILTVLIPVNAQKQFKIIINVRVIIFSENAKIRSCNNIFFDYTKIKIQKQTFIRLRYVKLYIAFQLMMQDFEYFVLSHRKRTYVMHK